MPESTNVLTQIDKMEKTFKGVRTSYDILCEIVHPNSIGTQVFGKPSEALDFALSEENVFVDVAIAKAMIAPMYMIEIAGNECTQTENVLMPLVQGLERQYGPTPQDWAEHAPK